MKRIEVIKFLVDDTEKKLRELMKYEAAIEAAEEEGESWWSVNYDGPLKPTPAPIKENLKVIRRLSSELMKELS